MSGSPAIGPTGLPLINASGVPAICTPEGCCDSGGDIPCSSLDTVDAISSSVELINPKNIAVYESVTTAKLYDFPGAFILSGDPPGVRFLDFVGESPIGSARLVSLSVFCDEITDPPSIRMTARICDAYFGCSGINGIRVAGTLFLDPGQDLVNGQTYAIDAHVEGYGDGLTGYLGEDGGQDLADFDQPGFYNVTIQW